MWSRNWIRWWSKTDPDWSSDWSKTDPETSCETISMFINYLDIAKPLKNKGKNNNKIKKKCNTDATEDRWSMYEQLKIINRNYLKSHLPLWDETIIEK